MKRVWDSSGIEVVKMPKKAMETTKKKTARKHLSTAVAPAVGTGAGGSTTTGDIRRLVRLMVDNGLTELSIKEGSKEVVLKRGSAQGLPAGGAWVAAAPAPAASDQPAPVAKEAAAAQELLEVRSPMVGTFYRTPSPDGEPYMDVGDTVEVDSVVCIVEAMKVMNEIKADCNGTIAEVCVQNAQPVEYGQVLFKVRPA